MSFHVTYRSELELLTCKTTNSELKYRVFQIYGQKYVKLIEPTVDPEPMSEVFASNIPRHIAIDELFKFFFQCGEIYQLRLLMDFSGSNRGKCFVQYSQVKSSREAICCLHEEIIDRGHRVFIRLSLNNNQLILKSIPGWISDKEMKEFVERNIGEGLISVVVKKSKIPNSNYCLCTYQDHQFAVMAHKKSWPFVNVLGALIDVHWAIPKLLRHNVKLYFTHFFYNLTKKELFDCLFKLIDVKTLVQFRIVNCYGFITFIDFQSMKTAECALQNFTVQGIRMKISRFPFKKGICVDTDGSPVYKQNAASIIKPKRTQPLQPISFFNPYMLQSHPLTFRVNVPVFMVPHISPFRFYNTAYTPLS